MKAKGSVIQDLILNHHRYRRNCLNLIPSENIVSRSVLSALSNDLAGRYASRPRFYGGTKYAEKIWEETELQAKQVFSTENASVAPLSGHLSCMITLAALSSQRDLVAALSPEHGGYPGFERGMINDALCRDVEHLPYDKQERNIDLNNAIDYIRRARPRIVVLGASLFLFPHPVREISDEVHSYNGYVVYDGSHVLGLIAGGEFQKPLDEGADVLFGSTHKTFPGPQGGVILCNDTSIFSRIERNIYHKFVDNIHLNRVAALGVALEEMKRYGREYAKLIVGNARSLADSLKTSGVPVADTQKGTTASHQVFVDLDSAEASSRLVQDLRDNPKVSIRERLEEVSIIVDSGVRLGTAEVTRRGMKNKEMRMISSLIYQVVSQGKTAGVKKQVEALLRKHKRIRYSLDKG